MLVKFKIIHIYNSEWSNNNLNSSWNSLKSFHYHSCILLYRLCAFILYPYTTSIRFKNINQLITSYSLLSPGRDCGCDATKYELPSSSSTPNHWNAKSNYVMKLKQVFQTEQSSSFGQVISLLCRWNLVKVHVLRQSKEMWYLVSLNRLRML